MRCGVVAKYKTDHLFVVEFFHIWINCSLSPLWCSGSYGELLKCLTLFCFKNWANWSEMNCRPLSETIWWGNPWTMKIRLNSSSCWYSTCSSWHLNHFWPFWVAKHRWPQRTVCSKAVKSAFTHTQGFWAKPRGEAGQLQGISLPLDKP